ncbi:MAG: YicC/YloC family endoribonuclease [Candidatus Methylomirabilia bacterium]
MIRSMTGYGRAEVVRERIAVTVEARSLNHRHLDISVKLPRSLASLELEARRLIQGHLQRGRVDVTVELRAVGSAAEPVKVDGARAREYAEAVRQVAADLGLPGTVSLDWLLGRPGVLLLEESEPFPVEESSPLLAEALTRALAALSARREAEGEALREALRTLHESLVAQVERIMTRVPLAQAHKKERLGERVRALLGDITMDEGRLATEVALLAERADITEELTRLRAHLDQFAGLVKEGGGVGRTLDFLIQEMNRETNTAAAKADDIEISQATIAVKGLLEKLREQVQNIE